VENEKLFDLEILVGICDTSVLKGFLYLCSHGHYHLFVSRDLPVAQQQQVIADECSKILSQRGKVDSHIIM